MQVRKAIILPLGALLKKVDTTDFISDMIAQAKYENKGFELTPAIKQQAMMLCEQYNLGALTSEQFMPKFLNVLSIKQLEADEFWRKWNDIVIAENISNKVKRLQETAQQRQCVFYLLSDTNPAHIAYIAERSKREAVVVQTDCNPIKVAEMPLYTSYQQKKSRLPLIQHVVEAIKNQNNNKPDEIVLVSSDPMNVYDEDLRKHAEAERKVVFAWCAENNVKVKNHVDDLTTTLLDIYMPQVMGGLTDEATVGFTRRY